MSIPYYGLLLGVAASLSLLTAGCGAQRAAQAPDPAGTRVAAPIAAQQTAARESDDTDKTLWTWLGLAKRESERGPGPRTGSTVSPVLWLATIETLDFVAKAAEDPMGGVLVTNWYSPPDKPHDRLRVSVFILSRALRSDSVAVTVERQELSSDGEWRNTPVSRDVVTGLENAILLRARQIRAEQYRSARTN
jgi:hypothetical protein